MVRSFNFSQIDFLFSYLKYQMIQERGSTKKGTQHFMTRLIINRGHGRLHSRLEKKKLPFTYSRSNPRLSLSALHSLLCNIFFVIILSWDARNYLHVGLYHFLTFTFQQLCKIPPRVKILSDMSYIQLSIIIASC